MTREEMKQRYTGGDNYHRPKQEFLDKIEAMDDAALQKETEHDIWISAYTFNNPRSDYHWMCDACYDEAQVRGKPEIYTRAWEKASKS